MLTGAKAASPVSSCCRLRPATWLSVVHIVVVVSDGVVVVYGNVVSLVDCTTTPSPGVNVMMNVLPDSVVDVDVDVDVGLGGVRVG